jgi:serine/threonine protein kinase
MGLKCVTPNDKSFRLDIKKKLGRGGFGFVFKGKYNGQEAAVKRILLDDVSNSREETALQKFDHENVVKLYHHRDDENFRYIYVVCFINNVDLIFIIICIMNRHEQMLVGILHLSCVLQTSVHFVKENTKPHPCPLTLKCFSSWPQDLSTFIR